MKNCAILLAAGHSSRMQGTDKLIFELSEKMVVEYSIEALFKHKLVDHVTIVTSKKNSTKIKSIITTNYIYSMISMRFYFKINSFHFLLSCIYSFFLSIHSTIFSRCCSNSICVLNQSQ